MDLQNRISLRALKVWRITGMITTVFVGVLAIILVVLTEVFDWSVWVTIISVISVVLIALFSIFLLPNLRYKWWRYEVRENEIEIQKGIFIVTRTLVPMVRVQHVDTQQGPIMRRNDLATVEVSTAATVHEIPALDLSEAESLRQYIAKMVQMVKEDV
ncbi:MULTISPECIES: PH domain-containing protein [Bacillus]|uniref:PH domain-containing protein n=1 Tax=Bacillus TaxID=1386 RepID=UPI000373A70E|nr:MULTISPECIES: PH domain-containing protein [Bacillus]